MRKHLPGLDHAVLRVADLDRAARDFAALGFTLAPRGRHSLGTENHCLMFGFDYLELVWVPPAVTPPFYADFPVAGDAMTGLALKSNNAAAVRDAWTREGLDPGPLIEFSRPVERGLGASATAPGGASPGSLTRPLTASATAPVAQSCVPSSDLAPLARFRVVALPPERAPGGRVFACEHLTPDLVWRPGLQRHANHVTGISKVIIASDNPAADGILWSRIFDIDPHPIPGGVSITTGAAPVVILTPDAIRRQLPRVELLPFAGISRFAALYLSVSDLPAAAAVVRGSGFHPVALADGSFAVPPGEAHGVALVFK